MAAKTDQSPGVLLASGYIAGATMAGVILQLPESEREYHGQIDRNRRVGDKKQPVF